jgi:hypothetical protein
MSLAAQMTRDSWIVGSGGAAKLSRLSENLFQKIQDADAKRTGTFSPHYLPWLTCPVRADRIGVRDVAPSEDRILRDEYVLRRLRMTYWASRNAPLGEVSIASKCIAIDVHAGKRNLQILKSAIDLVATTNDSWKIRFQSLARFIVPLKTIGKGVRVGGVGFSSEFAKGAIFLSIPKTEKFPEIELSINLAHEMGHQSLMIFQSGDRIIDGDLGLPVFSGVRKTNRPAIQSFHAMIALVSMVEYALSRLDNPIPLSVDGQRYLRNRLEALLRDLAVAVAGFTNIPLTRIGQVLYGESRSLLAKAESMMEERTL